MRTISRISAATILVALLTATLVAATGTTADAATNARRGFRPPTTHTLVKITCTKVDSDTWNVDYKWRVRGGRYVNLGNGMHYKRHNDNVRRGGKRFLTTGTQISGWGEGTPEAPTTDTATYSQFIAPIGNRGDWTELEDTQEVNLDCN